MAAAAKVKRDTVLAAEAARLAAVGTVRTCRFCDVEVPLDEHVEAHVRGKKHKKNEKEYLQKHPDADQSSIFKSLGSLNNSVQRSQHSEAGKDWSVVNAVKQ